jgi:hypothetical protein
VVEKEFTVRRIDLGLILGDRSRQRLTYMQYLSKKGFCC